MPIQELEKAGFFPEDTRKIETAFIPNPGEDALGNAILKRSQKTLDASTPSLLTEIKMLYARELSNLRRDKVALMARFLFTTFLSLLIGVIFLDVGKADPALNANINSQFGAIVIVMLMAMFGSAQPELIAFPEQRPIFLREYSTDHYSVVSYFMARLTMECVLTALQTLLLVVICFYLIGSQSSFIIFYAATYALAMASTALGVLLGSGVEDPKLAQEFLPLLFVPQILFAGFYVTPALIPVWLRWARYLCTVTFALRIVLVAEFDRDCGSVQGNDNCQGLLEGIEATGEDTWWYWLVLASLFGFFRLSALLILQKKASKFY